MACRKRPQSLHGLGATRKFKNGNNGSMPSITTNMDSRVYSETNIATNQLGMLCARHGHKDGSYRVDILDSHVLWCQQDCGGLHKGSVKQKLQLITFRKMDCQNITGYIVYSFSLCITTVALHFANALSISGVICHCVPFLSILNKHKYSRVPQERRSYHIQDIAHFLTMTLQLISCGGKYRIKCTGVCKVSCLVQKVVALLMRSNQEKNYTDVTWLISPALTHVHPNSHYSHSKGWSCFTLQCTDLVKTHSNSLTEILAEVSCKQWLFRNDFFVRI